MAGLTGWIENRAGEILGSYKLKPFSFKGGIGVYSSEAMREERFYAKQQEIIRENFAVIDSHSNAYLGYLKKGAWSNKCEIYNTNQQPIGKIYLARAGKYVLELEGRPVAEVNQKSKIWEINCTNIPMEFDRRILLSCILLMGGGQIVFAIVALAAFIIVVITALKFFL